MQVFINQLSGRLSEELAVATRLKVKPTKISDPEFGTIANSGIIKWVVSLEQQLFVIPKFIQGQEISHTVLTNGEPVLAAGEADIAGDDGEYYLLNINNHSGHYQPSLNSLEIGKEAFIASGINILDSAI